MKPPTIHPIASRCGVFAKTDVQPLLNEGAPQGGHRRVHLPIGGHPDHLRPGVRPPYPRSRGLPSAALCSTFPSCVNAFYETLELDDEHIIVPENAHLFVASGCAIAGAASETVKAELLSDVLEGPSEEPRRHPGLRSGASAAAVCRRGRARPVPATPRRRMRASRRADGLRGHGLSGHRRRFHYVQGCAHRRGRRASVVALRQQQGRRAGLRPRRADQPVQRHAGECRHGRAARAYRPRHGDRLRRALAAGSAARGFRRDRDRGSPARRAGDAAGRGRSSSTSAART